LTRDIQLFCVLLAESGEAIVAKVHIGRRVVHDILHDQMSSPVLLAWLFG